MFTAYIKNLNDMVFSTSDSPEEQPSTGVLGRIGSWFSPWRGNAPKSPTENDSPTTEQPLESDGGDDSEESVKQQWGEVRDQRSNPTALHLARDIFLCEEQDATQSGHKRSSVVSGAEAEQGGPKEEESAVCKKKRIGQEQEWEESSNDTSVSGNPEKNANHLTHLPSLSKQGVAWDSDQAHAQPQAQAARRLHVYLEETSVTHCGQDTCAGQEVVRTEVTKNLKVLTKSKSSPGFDLSACAGSKHADVKHVAGAQKYYSALAGVSLKSHKHSQSEPEPDREETETDGMGRRNSSRRRHRKNSQGDGGNSPRDKTPTNSQPAPEGFPPPTSPQGESPTTQMGESPVNPTSQHKPASQASPEGVGSKTCRPDAAKQLEDFQDSTSRTADAPACVVDGGTEMEDDESLYRVQRKTETPESKRRSIKVSRSEVKLFTKYVPFSPKQSPAGNNQGLTLGVKNSNNEERDKPKTETEARRRDPKPADEKLKPKPVPGRLADKISLFERKQTAKGHKQVTQTFQSPRSADVSPVRKAPEETKADVALSDQRSRSAEGRGAVRSSSASPVRDELMSVKARLKDFSGAEAKPAQPQKAAMTGMSQELPPPPAPESTDPDSQSKLDTKEPKETKASKITVKPDGQDTTIGKTKDPSTGSRVAKTMTPKTANQENQENRSNCAESQVPLKEPSDSSEMTNNISPQLKGSRPKIRKSKDSTSPVSPNGEPTPTSKMEVAALKQRKAADTDKTFSAPIRATEKLSSDKAQGNASDKQVCSDTKEKPLKELEVLDKPEKQIHSSHQKENIDKAIEPGELPASRDEPDTAAGNDATKSVDKDPVVLPQKEKKAGGQSLAVTRERETASEDSGTTSASSPSPTAERTIDRTLTQEQESPAAPPEPNQQLPMQPEPKSKGKVRQPSKKGAEQTPQHKDTEIIHQADSQDAAKPKTAENENANQSEKKDRHQPLRSDADTTKGKDSESGRGSSRTQGSVDESDESKNTRTKDKAQAIKEATQAEPASQPPEQTRGPSSSGPCVQTHVGQTGRAANEALSGAGRDKGPLKGEAPTNVPPELQTKSTQIPGREKKCAVSATEPRANSVSLEKTENSLDDSRTRGARDEFSGSKPITRAATAVEEVTVKATNDTPALITAQAGNTAEEQSSIKATTPISVSKSMSGERTGWDDGGENSTVTSEPSEVKVSGDVIQLAPMHLRGEESKKPASTSGTSSPKGAEKIEKSSSDSSAVKSTVNVTEKTAEKMSSLPVNEPSPVANGDISLRPQTIDVKMEPVSNKPCQTPKAFTSPEANKPTPDSIQHSSMKKLHLPRGQSRDDSSKRQDAPSSWLDVDLPKRKLKVSKPKLSSAGSVGNILDTSGELDDDDFVEKIKNLCAPFSLPPRKHNHLRPPQPPFAMPAIKEDRFEKTFDPEEFTIGLRKKTQFTLDTAPSLLAQLQNPDAKCGLKPARASLADRSMLLSNLDSHSRLREKVPVKAAEEIKEEKDDQIKVKSRLEGSCILSSLTSPSVRGKRNGPQTHVDGTSSGDVSPGEAGLLSPSPLSQPPLASPAATGPIRDQLAQQSPAPSDKEEAQAAVAVAYDSGPPLPRFDDVRLPDYLDKYLPREQVKSAPSTQRQEQAVKEVNGKTSTPVLGGDEDPRAKPGPPIPNAVPPCVPGPPANTQPTVPEPEQPAAQPQGLLSKNTGPVSRFHKRPGKMVLFEKARFGGQAHEIYRDVADATSLRLSPLISVKVVRGCWILYEKPDFQGRSIAVEEGATELANEWAEAVTDPHNAPPMQIGSVRLAVWDYSIPRIDLFTEPDGHGRVTPYHDDTIETGSFGIPANTASIQVHAGVWLVFSDPGFQGMVAMLEPGQYPVPETWGFPSPFVGSLRPLKMGGFKVENPSEVKAVVYEKPHFEGSCLEIDSDVFSFCEDDGDGDGALPDSQRLKAVGSLKVTGGLWVGYSQPGFEGQQHVLEEGEYLDCSDWGGSEQILSLRPILADFVAPHVKLFADRNFAELGGNVDLTGPVVNMDDTGYGTNTESIDVIGGVWVVFEEPDFCGNSYILEKGLYGSPEDWGALRPRVASAMPVLLDDFENAAKYKVQLFSDAAFQGSILSLEDSAATLPHGFTVASCKVLAGSWLAFEGQDFTGRMYVLEVGSYPDLRAMGCDNASSSIQSLHTVGFEFSLPSIILFERCGLRGKRVVLTDGSVNLQLAGGCSRVQSVLVEGAIWILYERFNYQGAQILLKPGEILDWRKFSSWQKIGSLRPLIQKQVHFRLRNRQTGLVMSVTGSLDDVQLMRIQETEETGGLEQIWFYQNGHLHCKLLEECCLSPSGSVTIAGSRTGLSTEPGIHLWSITPEGFILYTPTPNLVLEVKGGHNYDKTQVILNSLDPNKPQQRWNVEIM